MQGQIRRHAFAVKEKRCMRSLDTIKENAELGNKNENFNTCRFETTITNDKAIRNRRLADCYDNDQNLQSMVQGSQQKKSSSESSEILTPFQATEGIKIMQPSYWVGCSYVFRPKSQRLVLTIRQTGVTPKFTKDKQVSKLKAHVFLISKDRRMNTSQSVVLMESSNDKSFKSKTVTFKNLTQEEVRSSDIRICVTSHKWFSKSDLCEMNFSLEDCKPVLHKTEWCRVLLSQ